jgi:hypothetical protein
MVIQVFSLLSALYFGQNRKGRKPIEARYIIIPIATVTLKDFLLIFLDNARVGG